MPEADSWMRSTFSAIGTQRLHAIGVITLRWTMCEHGLFLLFCAVAQVSEGKGSILAHNLGDLSLSERIRALADFRRLSSETKESIENALACYDICRQNRNSVIHSWTSRVEGELFLARKSKKMDSSKIAAFASGVADLRRVADEIGVVTGRMFVLEDLLAQNDGEQHIALLDKLPALKLLWNTPLLTQTAHLPPPQSSSA